MCAECGADLTVPVDRVALPPSAPAKVGNGLAMPVLMPPRTYAVDPEPSGAPWREWASVTPEEAAA
ncbi:hypothetical protein CLV40_105255 [Actinokineospora auranticolor]|uniref:Uncharacterized protein n=1 Tax=Actinokineospora auranticolor TaxID=155976 RepID=A0A2S6GTK5_9PSEU|nr:hypothetical protein CLV40_105255 [Actinokineospora auranticolor]